MPRRVPIPPPELKEPALETWTLKLKTITPMFGGSAIPREVDQKNPVRAASIRGHLRFWWRATAGARYATAEELFRAEEEIWGSAERYGRVALRVVEQRGEKPVRPTELVPDKGTAKTGPMERFFLHPFNENKKEGLPEASGFQTVAFTLQLTLNLSEPEQEHLRRAIRAWIAFGGIGARSRRGVGALEVTEDLKDWLPSSPEELKEWFSIQSPKEAFHTTLAGAVVCLGEARRPGANDPYKGYAAWRELGKFGLLGLSIPEEHGGSGGGVLEITALNEALALAGVPTLFLVVTGLARVPIVRHGTREQIAKYVTPTCTGEKKMCFAITEPNAGTNSFAMSTLATRNADGGWTLNGQKVFISGARDADYMQVVARTTKAGEVAHRTDGMSLFVLDMKTPGIKLQQLNIQVETAERQYMVFFDNVQLPA
ncbi:MAG: type III-B CRISPR module RAMP protein Cmr1, partial [Candidatus Bipolaricaulaceae bacterium]